MDHRSAVAAVVQVRVQIAAVQPDHQRADVDEPRGRAAADGPGLRHRPVPAPAGLALPADGLPSHGPHRQVVKPVRTHLTVPSLAPSCHAQVCIPPSSSDTAISKGTAQASSKSRQKHSEQHRSQVWLMAGVRPGNRMLSRNAGECCVTQESLSRLRCFEPKLSVRPFAIAHNPRLHQGTVFRTAGLPKPPAPR